MLEEGQVNGQACGRVSAEVRHEQNLFRCGGRGAGYLDEVKSVELLKIIECVIDVYINILHKLWGTMAMVSSFAICSV